MSNLFKNFAWAIVTLLVIALVFSAFLEPGKEPEALSLSELAERINAGAVGKIDIAGDDLKIKLADGGEATSKKEAEVGLSETLRNFGVDVPALAKVEIAV